jgi:hypothetical protein
MRLYRILFVAGAILSVSMARAETIYRVGGDVKAPKKIADCPVEVPADVRGKKIKQPFFIYDAVITKSGDVRSVQLVSGPHGDPYDSIDRSFRKQIKCWRFQPATFHGKPVTAHYNLTASLEVR